MVSAMKYILAVAIIASVACSAYALQCYNCDSARDPHCGEKFDAQDNFKLDCSRAAPPRNLQYGSYSPTTSNATGCMKKLIDYLPGQPRIERSCFFGDPSHTASGCAPDASLPFQRQLSCDVCTGNLCNGASASAPIGLAILLFFAFARLFA